MAHERVVVIQPDHPSLPGHFPGYPVVPGVVLLNEVMDSLYQLSEQPARVTGLPMVKFASPLKPGEAVTIRMEEDGPNSAMFRCHVGARLVASGSLQFTRLPPDETGAL